MLKQVCILRWHLYLSKDSFNLMRNVGFNTLDHFPCVPAHHGLRYLGPVFPKCPSAQNTLKVVQCDHQMAFLFEEELT